MTDRGIESRNIYNEAKYFPAGEWGVTVKNIGADTVYYGGATVTTSSYTGTISAGASATFTTGQWFVAATQTKLRLDYVTEYEYLDGRLTDLEAGTSGTTTTFLNVKDDVYGAVGNGTTDDTTAIQTALSAAALLGGAGVFFPEGTYKITSSLTVYSRTALVGSGRESTIIKRGSADFDMLTFYGVSTGVNSNRCTYASMKDLTLHGNSRTGRVCDVVYADNLDFRNIYMTANDGPGLDLVEVWDSLFDNIVFENVSSATEPSINIRSSRAASGFGSGTDTSNVLRFTNCRAENFQYGAIEIDDGTGATQDVNHLWFDKFKMESRTLRGKCVNVIRGNLIWFNNLYCYPQDFDSGFVGGAQIALDLDGIGIGGALTNSHIGNGSVATVSTGVRFFQAAPIFVHNVIGTYTTAPTSGNHIDYAGGGPYAVGQNWASNVTTVDKFQTGIRGTGPGPIMRAAPPSDSSWDKAPPDGTLAYNNTSHAPYTRSGGVWEFGQPYSTGSLLTVASAATTMDIANGTLYSVTGTTGITSIPATRVGHMVILVFASTPTVTDGGNLKLASTLSATADDTLTLVCDGTNWIEVARSVN